MLNLNNIHQAIKENKETTGTGIQALLFTFNEDDKAVGISVDGDTDKLSAAMACAMLQDERFKFLIHRVYNKYLKGFSQTMKQKSEN